MPSNTKMGDRKKSQGQLTIQNSRAPTKLISTKLIWKADKRGIEDGEIHTPVDLAFLPDGSLVVGELQNERLQLFNPDGKCFDVLGEGQLRPSGVVTDKVEGNIAATDIKGGTVRMYAADGDDIGSWKKNIFGMPQGIAVTSDDCFIITDQSDASVHMYEPEGLEIGKFGGKNGKNGKLTSPGYVTVDQNDRIIISDTTSHSIHVFDANGKFLLTFGGKGENNGELLYPNGVAADYHGNIFIADNGNHRVSMFSSAGKFIEHVLVKSDGIYWPEGVAISDNGKLAISEFGIENDIIKVFQI